jgi:Flp pilus assembly protein TadG
MLVFMSMVIAIIDFGQILYFQQALTERARAAARYAAINPTQTAKIKNVALYGTPTEPVTPKAILPSMTESMVQVTPRDLDKTSGTVTVSIVGYPMQFFTPGLARSFQNRAVSVTISSEAAF